MQMYYAEESKPKAFKPGWQSMRHEAVIKPYTQRLAAVEQRVRSHTRGIFADLLVHSDHTLPTAQEERQQTIQKMRTERLGELNTGKFNPITGCEKRADAWVPAADPWKHQRQGLRPAATIQQMDPKPVRPLLATALRLLLNLTMYLLLSSSART